MLANARLRVAARLDRWEARLRRVGEHLGWPQAWLQEFIDLSGDPRMTIEEFWVRYTLLRRETAPRFAAIRTEAEALAFYCESEYMLWRNLVHRRHSAWRRVLWTMPAAVGTLVEVGAATAPVSAYCARRRPHWRYHVLDIPGSPHAVYGQRRLARRGVAWDSTWPVPGTAHVVTLLDVLEHLADPLAMTRQAVRMLRPGGWLHWNFVGNPRRNDLDLATEAQRDETVAWLTEHLESVAEHEGYRLSRRAS